MQYASHSKKIFFFSKNSLNLTGMGVLRVAEFESEVRIIKFGTAKELQGVFNEINHSFKNSHKLSIRKFFLFVLNRGISCLL